MKKGYSANLKDGRPIYIPNWPVKVQFENLTQVCKLLGQDQVMAISSLNVSAAMVAVMESDDAQACTDLVMHFVMQARIDGDRIEDTSMDKLGMYVVLELFTHVIHAQYSDFFESGLAEAISQNKSAQEEKEKLKALA